MKTLKSDLSAAERDLLARIEKRWESVNATDSRQQLPSLVDEVRYTGTRKVLQKRNVAVAALVSIEDLMRLEMLDARRDAEAADRFDTIERNDDNMPAVDDVKAAKRRAAGVSIAAGATQLGEPEQDYSKAATARWQTGD